MVIVNLEFIARIHYPATKSPIKCKATLCEYNNKRLYNQSVHLICFNKNDIQVHKKPYRRLQAYVIKKQTTSAEWRQGAPTRTGHKETKAFNGDCIGTYGIVDIKRSGFNRN